MSAHTPGPWVAHLDRYSIRRDHALPVEVASVSTATISSHCGHYRIDHDEARANALLIAAAPDLLDALMQWQAADRDNDPRERMNARRSRDAAIAKALSALDDAINKATGGGE